MYRLFLLIPFLFIGCLANSNRDEAVAPVKKDKPPVSDVTVSSTIKKVLLTQQAEMVGFCLDLKKQAEADPKGEHHEDRLKAFNDKTKELGASSAKTISDAAKSAVSSGSAETEVWNQFSLGYQP